MPKAGLFAGEVTAQAPADGALVPTKQNGYQWMEYGIIPKSGIFPNAFITQNDYQVGVDHVSPFDDTDSPTFTMMSVFKPSGLAGLSGTDKAYMLQLGGYQISNTPDASMAMFIEQNSGAIWVNSRMVNTDGGNVYYNIDFKVTGTGAPTGWLISHWYCYVVSYDEGGVDPYRMGGMLVNLTLGEEVWDAGFTEDEQLGNVGQGDSTGWEESVCAYGCSAIIHLAPPDDPPLEEFDGFLYQQMLHDKFINLGVSANRRLFCDLTMVKDLDSGINVWGETALYFSKTGFPQDNTGTWDVDSGGYWLEGTVSYDTDAPPGAYK